MSHSLRNRISRLALSLITLLGTGACRERSEVSAAEAPADAAPTRAAITGTISYRERLALTDSAVVRVTLRDVSLQDVRAPLLAEQEITAPGQVPIRFELHYSPADIDERRSYAVRATIHDRGRLLFTTDTHVPVLTRGGGREAHLTVVEVPARANPPVQSRKAVEGTELEGMFSYDAGAGRFWDCRTGRSFPVSVEGDYTELERAYFDSGIEMGQHVRVWLRGRFQERRSTDENRSEVSLIVDKFENMDPDSACAPNEHAALVNTYWKLLELDGRAIVTPEGMREAHLILASGESRAHGNAGCNRFFGSFESAGDRLEFSALGTTRMACPEGMDTEQGFLQALGETTRFTISGQILTLLAGDRPLARLEAVYL